MSKEKKVNKFSPSRFERRSVGGAVDEDPDVNATLTIPNFSAQEVIGVDVLNGY